MNYSLRPGHVTQFRILLLYILFLTPSLSSSTSSSTSNNISISKPPVILSHVSFPLSIHLPTLYNGATYKPLVKYKLFLSNNSTTLIHEGHYSTLDGNNTQSTNVIIRINNVVIDSIGQCDIKAVVYSNKEEYTGEVSAFVSPGILSITPPVITLLLSSLCGNVVLALILGIYTGCLLVYQGNIVLAFYHTFDVYWVASFTSREHASVLLFTLLLGGCIGIVQKGGGGHGLAKYALTYMTSRFRMQLATVLLCTCIFFDDFSCILIVGNSLKNILLETGVSNEKFGIILHIMSVCLPSIAPVSSWVGVEIGYISAQINDLNLEYDPFVLCLKSIGYRFFPLLMMIFLIILIYSEKDFGPVVHYERQAITIKSSSRESKHVKGPLDPKPENPQRPLNAVIPFALIVLFTFIDMIYDGYRALPQDEARSLLNALSHSDSISALLRASSIGCLVSLLLVVTQHLLTMQEGMNAWMEGIKDILEPTMVLLLAWALGSVIKDVQAAEYLANVVKDDLDACWLPTVSGVLCYIVSFATGSSFGTMAIMFPIIAPLSYKISNSDPNNLLQCFGAILGASTFGNTCSPIADTSILTSLSTSIPLQRHVDTILPYSTFIAIVSLLFGTLPVGLGWYNPYIAFLVMVFVVMAFVIIFGKKHVNESGSFHVDDHSNGTCHENGYKNGNHNAGSLFQENVNETMLLLSSNAPSYV